MQQHRDTGGETGEAARRLIEVRTRLAALADDLSDLNPAPVVHRSDEDADALIERMDTTAIEARRIESLLVRRIVDLDRQTRSVLDPLHVAPPVTRQDGLLRLFGIGGSSIDGKARDRQAAAALRGILTHTHELLALLEDHREFLLDLLGRCEPRLDLALGRLRDAGSSVDEQALREDPAYGIDILQDYVDRVIDMLSAFNLLVNKLALDAEERVLSLRGLASDTLQDAALDAPRLSTLFMRAERGLLTVHGLAARKARVDDAFRRRLSSSRQPGNR